MVVSMNMVIISIVISINSIIIIVIITSTSIIIIMVIIIIDTSGKDKGGTGKGGFLNNI